MAAGVPVAMADSGVNGDSPIASIITDQYKGGFMAGEEMARLLDGKGKVANLGIQAGSVSAGRSVGFADAIAQYPDMEVLETQWTDADAAKSLNIATDLITGNPDIAGFFSAAAPIASGIAQAAIAKGIDKTVKIITFDPSPEILPLFDDGTIQAIIAQDPYQMGYQGVAAIDAFINGQTIRSQEHRTGPCADHSGEYRVGRGPGIAPDPGQVHQVAFRAVVEARAIAPGPLHFHSDDQKIFREIEAELRHGGAETRRNSEKDSCSCSSLRFLCAFAPPCRSSTSRLIVEILCKTRGASSCRQLNIGLIGTGFMGRTHSNAYRQVNTFFPHTIAPACKTVCGRNEQTLRDFAAQLGLGEDHHQLARAGGRPGARCHRHLHAQ